MPKRILVSLPIIFVLAGAAWYFSKPAAKDAAKAARPQIVSVSTVAARRMDVPVRLQANGYVSSLNSVEVRPQVSNIITKVHIREGQFVKAGEILFSLDDRADKVGLQKAEAQLAKDRAALADAERQLKRSKELVGKGFISQSALDTVQTQVESARATVQADQAAVAAAQVALGYDTIRAPSSGRAGAIQVFAGSLVQPSTGTPPLVTISQLDPVAVSFTLPEQELSALLQAQRAGNVTVTANPAGTPLEGRISFVDNAVDPQNGTIKVKAVFPNQSQLLWPGQYVPVSTAVREIKNGVIVPQAAIITGADTSTVYTVGPDKKAQPREVTIVYSFGTQAVVNGLKEGEHIVVDGKQNLRPGSQVKEAGAEKGADAATADGASKSKA